MTDAATTSSRAELSEGAAHPLSEKYRRNLSDFAIPESTHDEGAALDAICAANRARRTWTVVLDDDPTGTQTVQGLPVLLPGWADKDLRAAADEGATTFLLTNTRSIDRKLAADLTYRLVHRAAHVAASKHLQLRVISRSDSTLRGHFATELKATSEALADAGTPVDGVVFVPCFLEGGRYTAENVQWLARGDVLVPTAHTEFATDNTFGYREVDLCDWVRARLAAPDARVDTISLDQLRSPDGVTAVSSQLQQLFHGEIAIINATLPTDLEVLMLAVLDAEDHGRRLVIRSGPSFVRACAGQRPAAPVHAAVVYPVAPKARYGLVVVGSHTALTNDQLAAATHTHPLVTIELGVQAVLDPVPSRAAAEIDRCVREVTRALSNSDVVLRTGRSVVTGGRATPLLASRAVADALTAAVAGIASAHDLRFLVAKGGITSSDIAHHALGATRANVVGQLLPGQIPLWALIDGLLPHLPYVVFPGNVGTEDALSTVLTTLRAA